MPGIIIRYGTFHLELSTVALVLLLSMVFSAVSDITMIQFLTMFVGHQFLHPKGSLSAVSESVQV